MAKSYKQQVQDSLTKAKAQGEFKTLLAFLKKHKITNKIALKRYLKLRQSELKDYLKTAQKIPTMNSIRRRKTKELAWISFVQKNYLPRL